jgi:hypothetical protein
MVAKEGPDIPFCMSNRTTASYWLHFRLAQVVDVQLKK